MSPAPEPCLAFRRTRVRELMAAAGLDLLIVGHLSNIRYLTNFVGSSAILVLGLEDAQFITDSRYTVAAAALFESADGNGVTRLVTVDRSYEETLGEVVQRVGAPRVGFEAVHLSFRRYELLAAAIGANAELVPTDRIVERARAVKDGYEVETLRTAARLLSGAARGLLAAARPGRTERAVASEVDGVLREVGFERVAFETIVASGPNSALPHARPGSRILQPGDLVVLDFGGVYDGYCVDLTRTRSIAEPDLAQRRLHDAVAEAQFAAIATIRPGIFASDVDEAARRVLDSKGFGEAFAHGTGHGLGLEVHEEPRIGRRDPDQQRALASGADGPLESGMVFTVEPGAYQPGLGGVRIEDDVLVTDEGCEVLTGVTRELWGL